MALTQEEIRAALMADYFDRGPVYGYIDPNGKKHMCPIGRIAEYRGYEFDVNRQNEFQVKKGDSLRMLWDEVMSHFPHDVRINWFELMGKEQFDFLKRFETLLDEAMSESDLNELETVAYGSDY